MPVTVTKYASAFASVAGAGPDWSSVGDALDGTLQVTSGDHDTLLRATDADGATKVDDLDLTLGSCDLPSNATDIKARVRVWMNVNTQGQTPDNTPNTIAWRLTANGSTTVSTGLSNIAFPLIVESTTPVVYDSASEFGTNNGISNDPENPDYYFVSVTANGTNIGRLNDAALRVRVIPPTAGNPLAEFESVGIFPIALDVAQAELTVVYSAVPLAITTLEADADPGTSTCGLEWDPNVTGKAATTHEVRYGLASDALNTTVAADSNTNHVLTGLTAGTTYFAAVYGINEDGTSLVSNIVTFTTDAAGGSGAGTRAAINVARMMSLALGDDLTTTEEGLI